MKRKKKHLIAEGAGTLPDLLPASPGWWKPGGRRDAWSPERLLIWAAEGMGKGESLSIRDVGHTLVAGGMMVPCKGHRQHRLTCESRWHRG